MSVAPISPAILAGTTGIRPDAAPVNPVPGIAGGLGAAASSAGGANAAVEAPAVAAATSLVNAAIDALALKAVTEASGGGLAQLMADLAEAQNVSGLPATVQAAIDQTLAQQTSLDVAPTSSDIQAALEQSNPEVPSQASGAQSSSDATSSLLPPVEAPLQKALVGLQTALQDWLAEAPAAAPGTPVPVPSAPPSPAQLPAGLANFADALSQSGLPTPLQNALVQSLAALPRGADPTPGAPASGGSLLPNSTAQQLAAPKLAAPSDLPANLQPVLPLLEQALKNLLAEGGGTANAPAMPNAAALAPPLAENAASLADDAAMPAAMTSSSPSLTAASAAPSAEASLVGAAAKAADGATPTALAQNAVAANATTLAASLIAALPATVDPKDVLAIFQQVFSAWFEAAATDAAAPVPASAGASETAGADADPSTPAPANAAAPAPPSPPPPYRGGPTTAQPAVPSSLPLNADPAAIGARLLRETNAALAHQQLLQIASLPSQAQATSPGAAQNPHWMFEIPFATPQGTAVAQFKVSRDNARGKAGAMTRVWRAQFSLDIEPMGPVHAQIVLAGDRSWVSLWAEREEGVARLRQNEGLLATSLQDANFAAEIAFHLGAPRQPAASAGKFLDRSS